MSRLRQEASSVGCSAKASLAELFTFPAWYGRFIKLLFLASAESAKLFLMVYCGCEHDGLNNWLSQAMLHPYQWHYITYGPAFIAGPYSAFWYAMMWPARYGYFPLMTYLFLFDVSVSYLVIRRIHTVKKAILTLPAWFYLSYYFYNVDPVDLFPFLLAVLGMVNPLFSIAAVIVKLPIPIPLLWNVPAYVWPWIVNDPYGIHEGDGFFRYLFLGLSWLFGIAYYTRKRFRKGKCGVVKLKHNG